MDLITTQATGHLHPRVRALTHNLLPFRGAQNCSPIQGHWSAWPCILLFRSSLWLDAAARAQSTSFCCDTQFFLWWSREGRTRCGHPEHPLSPLTPVWFYKDLHAAHMLSLYSYLPSPLAQLRLAQAGPSFPLLCFCVCTMPHTSSQLCLHPQLPGNWILR